MRAEKGAAVVSLFLALSIASEHLAEMFKGLIPFLASENSCPAACVTLRAGAATAECR